MADTALAAHKTPWGVRVGAGEERVECHAEVEAFAFPSAAGIGRLPIVSCDHGWIASCRRLSGADAATAGVVQFEPVGCAHGGPSAFVETMMVEATDQGEVWKLVLTAVGSVADVVDL